MYENKSWKARPRFIIRSGHLRVALCIFKCLTYVRHGIIYNGPSRVTLPRFLEIAIGFVPRQMKFPDGIWRLGKSMGIQRIR